jgi:hypothetical protein
MTANCPQPHLVKPLTGKNINLPWKLKAQRLPNCKFINKLMARGLPNVLSMFKGDN